MSGRTRSTRLTYRHLPLARRVIATLINMKAVRDGHTPAALALADFCLGLYAADPGAYAPSSLERRVVDVLRAAADAPRGRRPTRIAYAHAVLHFAERMIGLSQLAQFAAERHRARSCGTYATPDFVAHPMWSDLRRAFRRHRRRSLDILDLSVEAGQFPLTLLANARSLPGRTRYYAIDRDADAIALTNRLVEFASHYDGAKRVRLITACRDSLLDRLPAGWPKRFGAIVGNPPWQGRDWSTFEPIRRRFAPDLNGRVDVYLAFILRAHELLRPGGYLCMVVPHGFLFNVNATPVRRLLLDQYDLLTLRLYPQRSFVELSSVIPISFLARKRTAGDRPTRPTTITYQPGPVGGPARATGTRRTIVASTWRRQAECAFNPVAVQGIRFLLGNMAERRLGDFGVLWSGGRLTRSDGSVSPCRFIGIHGRDIRPFHVCPRRARRYGTGTAAFDREPRLDFMARRKVVFQDMRNPILSRRLIAAVAGERTYPVSTAAMFVPDQEETAAYFEALLNSAFANAWYKSRDVSRSIKLWYLDEFPIVYDQAAWQRIASLARQCSAVCTFLHSRLTKCPVGRAESRLFERFPRRTKQLSAYKSRIDEEIFTLYGLTVKQRHTVLRLAEVRAF